MQIVIDIPEKDYINISNSNPSYADDFTLYYAIKNSTSIPNSHGRLIDADEVVKEICIEYKVNSIYELPDELRSFIKKYLNEVPTILKPTTEYMIKNYAFSKSEG